MVRSRWQTALVLAAAAAVACGSSEGRPDEELGGLVVAPRTETRAIAVARVGEDPDELLRAAMMPHREVGALLGGHRFRGTSKIEVTEDGKVVESITDTTEIDFREDGEYRAVLENSLDYGRSAYYLEGQMLLAPRHSQFHKRPPADDDEPMRVRDEIFATLGAQLELVMHAAELTDRGGTQVAGRAARSIDLSLASKPRKPPAQVLPRKKWRESVTVKSLTGQVVVDADNAAPLGGKLDAELAFSRDGRSFVMTIAVTHTISDIGAAPALEPPPPDQIVVVADHHAEAAERDTLLEGIAPPARKAPTPANTTAAGDGK